MGLGSITGPQVRERGSFQSRTLVSAFRYSLSEALVPRRRKKKEIKKEGRLYCPRVEKAMKEWQEDPT